MTGLCKVLNLVQSLWVLSADIGTLKTKKSCHSEQTVNPELAINLYGETYCLLSLL